MKTELIEKVYTAKQIQAMKDAINEGGWGDAEEFFEGCEDDCNAWGCCTNDIHKAGNFASKEISGIISGISKKASKVQNGAIACRPDYWGDGSGDMIFFNLEALDCHVDELEEWAKQPASI